MGTYELTYFLPVSRSKVLSGAKFFDTHACGFLLVYQGLILLP